MSGRGPAYRGFVRPVTIFRTVRSGLVSELSLRSSVDAWGSCVRTLASLERADASPTIGARIDAEPLEPAVHLRARGVERLRCRRHVASALPDDGEQSLSHRVLGRRARAGRALAHLLG